MEDWKPIVFGAALFSVLCLGCATEKTDEAAEEPASTTIEVEEPQVLNITLGDASLRKLTRSQYANSLTDIFGKALVVPPTGEPDAISQGLASIGAANTPYSSLGVETFESAAFAIGTQLIGEESLRTAHIPCEESPSFDKNCAESVITTLGRALWRRPLTSEEVDAMVGVSKGATETLESRHEGLTFGIAGLLQSPYFLYRMELGTEIEGSEERAFDGYELATRLSYFLWNTTPDSALLDAAEAGLLDTEEGLIAEADRLLDDPRAREGLKQFYDEYLDLDEAEKLSKDPTVFEFFSVDYGMAIAEETRLLLDYIVFDGDRDFRELMTSKTTHLNPLLAALYDLPSPAEEGFTRVNLPADGPRAGLLGHASFLAQHSHQVSTSVTRRGEAVRKILLCQSIPSPPVDVDTSIPEPSGTAPTMRDRVAEHLQNPSCAGCHMLTDPIGLGLENFDGVGRYRVLDNGALIDPSGDLDQAEFQDALELGEAIGNHPDFSDCLVKTMTRYATGRLEKNSEREAVDYLIDSFETGGFRVKSLIREIIKSPLFRKAGGTN